MTDISGWLRLRSGCGGGFVAGIALGRIVGRATLLQEWVGQTEELLRIGSGLEDAVDDRVPTGTGFVGVEAESTHHDCEMLEYAGLDALVREP